MKPFKLGDLVCCVVGINLRLCIGIVVECYKHNHGCGVQLISDGECFYFYNTEMALLSRWE